MIWAHVGDENEAKRRGEKWRYYISFGDVTWDVEGGKGKMAEVSIATAPWQHHYLSDLCPENLATFRQPGCFNYDRESGQYPISGLGLKLPSTWASNGIPSTSACLRSMGTPSTSLRASDTSRYAVTPENSKNVRAERTDRISGRWCAIDGLSASAKARLVLPPQCSDCEVTVTSLWEQGGLKEAGTDDVARHSSVYGGRKRVEKQEGGWCGETQRHACGKEARWVTGGMVIVMRCSGTHTARKRSEE
jgi:hypothetical protein